MAEAPHPRTVQKFRAHGTADMGDASDDASIPRFGLGVPFELVYVRCWVSGGTGQAQMELKQVLHGEHTSLFDRVVRRFPRLGVDGDDYHDFIDFRVQANERQHWAWAGMDALVPEWTNPNSGTMAWYLEVGLAPF